MQQTALPQFVDAVRYAPVFSTDYLLAQTELPFVTRRVEAGEHVFLAGERCRHTFHVVGGLFKLYLTSAEGTSKALFFHAKGTQFGFQGFRGDGLTVSSAVAVCPGELLAIRFDDLLAYCDRHTDCYLAYISYLFQIMNSQTQEIANLSFQTGMRRLSGLLYALAGDEMLGGDAGALADGPVVIPYTVEELAEIIGSHRNTVSNALGALRKLGVVAARQRPVVVPSVARLRAYLEA